MRFFALVLAAAFGLQDLAFASADAGLIRMVLPAVKLPDFGLPTSVAVVEDAFTAARSRSAGSRAPRVILVRDAHTNPSGQFNLARTLDVLITREKLPVVYTEGASRDVSMSYLRNHADADKLARVSKEFVYRGQIKGSEYLELTGGRPFRIQGVEENRLYEKALRAYRAAAASRARAQRHLAELKTTCAFVREKTADAPLNALLTHHEAFYAGTVTWVDHLAFLSALSIRLGLTVTNLTELEALKKIQVQEQRLRWDRIQDEWDRAARAGIAADRAPVREYPHLRRYTAYQKAVSRLKVLKVVREQEALETELFKALARTPDEQRIVQTVLALEVLESLVTMSASPDQIARFRRDPDAHDPVRISAYLNRRIMQLDRGYERAIFLDPAEAEALARALSFYATADERDRVFLRRTLRQMRKDGLETAILITGGYHTDHLKALLKSRGISYAVVTPQVMHETDKARYEKLLLAAERATLIPRYFEDQPEAERNVFFQSLGVAPGGLAAARLAENRNDRLSELIEMAEKERERTAFELTGSAPAMTPDVRIEDLTALDPAEIARVILTPLQAAVHRTDEAERERRVNMAWLMALTAGTVALAGTVHPLFILAVPFLLPYLYRIKQSNRISEAEQELADLQQELYEAQPGDPGTLEDIAILIIDLFELLLHRDARVRAVAKLSLESIAEHAPAIKSGFENRVRQLEVWHRAGGRSGTRWLDDAAALDPTLFGGRPGAGLESRSVYRMRPSAFGARLADVSDAAGDDDIERIKKVAIQVIDARPGEFLTPVFVSMKVSSAGLAFLAPPKMYALLLQTAAEGRVRAARNSHGIVQYFLSNSESESLDLQFAHGEKPEIISREEAERELELFKIEDERGDSERIREWLRWIGTTVTSDPDALIRRIPGVSRDGIAGLWASNRSLLRLAVNLRRGTVDGADGLKLLEWRSHPADTILRVSDPDTVDTRSSWQPNYELYRAISHDMKPKGRQYRYAVVVAGLLIGRAESDEEAWERLVAWTDLYCGVRLLPPSPEAVTAAAREHALPGEAEERKSIADLLAPYAPPQALIAALATSIDKPEGGPLFETEKTVRRVAYLGDLLLSSFFAWGKLRSDDFLGPSPSGGVHRLISNQTLAILTNVRLPDRYAHRSEHMRGSIFESLVGLVFLANGGGWTGFERARAFAHDSYREAMAQGKLPYSQAAESAIRLLRSATGARLAGRPLYRDGKFRVGVIERILDECAAELTRQFGAQIKLKIVGGTRYLRSNRRKDLDVTMTAAGSRPQLLRAFAAEFNSRMSRYGYRANLRLSAEGNESIISRFDLDLGRANVQRLDLFILPSWATALEVQLNLWKTHLFQADFNPTLFLKTLLAAEYFVGSFQRQRRMIRDIQTYGIEALLSEHADQDEMDRIFTEDAYGDFVQRWKRRARQLIRMISALPDVPPQDILARYVERVEAPIRILKNGGSGTDAGARLASSEWINEMKEEFLRHDPTGILAKVFEQMEISEAEAQRELEPVVRRLGLDQLVDPWIVHAGLNDRLYVLERRVDTNHNASMTVQVRNGEWTGFGGMTFYNMESMKSEKHNDIEIRTEDGGALLTIRSENEFGLEKKIQSHRSFPMSSEPIERFESRDTGGRTELTAKLSAEALRALRESGLLDSPAWRHYQGLIRRAGMDLRMSAGDRTLEPLPPAQEWKYYGIEPLPIGEAFRLVQGSDSFITFGSQADLRDYAADPLTGAAGALTGPRPHFAALWERSAEAVTITRLANDAGFLASDRRAASLIRDLQETCRSASAPRPIYAFLAAEQSEWRELLRSAGFDLVPIPHPNRPGEEASLAFWIPDGLAHHALDDADFRTLFGEFFAFRMMFESNRWPAAVAKAHRMLFVDSAAESADTAYASNDPVWTWIRTILVERAPKDAMAQKFSAESQMRFMLSFASTFFGDLSSAHARKKWVGGADPRKLRKHLIASNLTALRYRLLTSAEHRTAFEKAIERFVLHGPKGRGVVRLTDTLENQNGFADLEPVMPTLRRILEDPYMTRRFVHVLTLLRMVFPEHVSSRSGLAPLEFSRRNGLTFRIGEFRIAPVSESFRRHILFTGSDENLQAIELKIPGQLGSKDYISPENYQVVRRMEEAYGPDVDAETALFFRSYEGEFSSYGHQRAFRDTARRVPLGITGYTYQDGKRLQHIYGPYPGMVSGFEYNRPIGHYLRELAERTGQSHIAMRNDWTLTILAHTIRYLALGYVGMGEAGFDNHPENVRIVHATGRARFVGDTAAFRMAESIGATEIMREIDNQLEFLQSDRFHTALQLWKRAGSAALKDVRDPDLRARIDEIVKTGREALKRQTQKSGARLAAGDLAKPLLWANQAVKEFTFYHLGGEKVFDYAAASSSSTTARRGISKILQRTPWWTADKGGLPWRAPWLEYWEAVADATHSIRDKAVNYYIALGYQTAKVWVPETRGSQTVWTEVPNPEYARVREKYDAIYMEARREDYVHWAHPPVIQDIRIPRPNHSDIPAHLILPTKNGTPVSKWPAVVIYAGLTNGAQQPYFDELEHRLVRRGFAVLRPDFPRHGRNEEPIKSDVELNGFTEAVLDGLKNHPEIDPERIGIFGFSFGGNVALRAYLNPELRKRIRGVVSMNPPLERTFVDEPSIERHRDFLGYVFGERDLPEIKRIAATFSLPISRLRPETDYSSLMLIQGGKDRDVSAADLNQFRKYIEEDKGPVYYDRKGRHYFYDKKRTHAYMRAARFFQTKLRGARLAENAAEETSVFDRLIPASVGPEDRRHIARYYEHQLAVFIQHPDVNIRSRSLAAVREELKLPDLVRRIEQAAVRLQATPARPVRILDVGAGRGVFLDLLATVLNRIPYRDATLLDSVELHGLEPLGAMPDAVKKWSRIRWHAGLGEYMYDADAGRDLPDDFFDVIYATQTLRYTFDPFQFLNQIRRKLKPGGEAFVSAVSIYDRYLFEGGEWWLGWFLSKKGNLEWTVPEVLHVIREPGDTEPLMEYRVTSAVQRTDGTTVRTVERATGARLAKQMDVITGSWKDLTRSAGKILQSSHAGSKPFKGLVIAGKFYPYAPEEAKDEDVPAAGSRGFFKTYELQHDIDPEAVYRLVELPVSEHGRVLELRSEFEHWILTRLHWLDRMRINFFIMLYDDFFFKGPAAMDRAHRVMDSMNEIITENLLKLQKAGRSSQLTAEALMADLVVNLDVFERRVQKARELARDVRDTITIEITYFMREVALHRLAQIKAAQKNQNVPASHLTWAHYSHHETMNLIELELKRLSPLSWMAPNDIEGFLLERRHMIVLVRDGAGWDAPIVGFAGYAPDQTASGIDPVIKIHRFAWDRSSDPAGIVAKAVEFIRQDHKDSAIQIEVHDIEEDYQRLAGALEANGFVRVGAHTEKPDPDTLDAVQTFRLNPGVKAGARLADFRDVSATARKNARFVLEHLPQALREPRPAEVIGLEAEPRLWVRMNLKSGAFEAVSTQPAFDISKEAVFRVFMSSFLAGLGARPVDAADAVFEASYESPVSLDRRWLPEAAFGIHWERLEAVVQDSFEYLNHIQTQLRPVPEAPLLPAPRLSWLDRLEASELTVWEIVKTSAPAMLLASWLVTGVLGTVMDIKSAWNAVPLIRHLPGIIGYNFTHNLPISLVAAAFSTAAAVLIYKSYPPRHGARLAVKNDGGGDALHRLTISSEAVTARNIRMIRRYSRYKFGDAKEARAFSDEVAAFVKEQHPGLLSSGNAVVMTPPRNPFGSPVTRVAKEAAAKLELPYVEAMELPYEPQSYTSLKTAGDRRRMLEAQGFELREDIDLTGKQVLLIEDMSTTGTSIWNARRNLKERFGVDEDRVIPVTLVKLRTEDPSLEKRVSRYLLEENAWESLFAILNEPSHVVTTFWMREWVALPDADRTKVLRGVKTLELQKMLVTAALYFHGMAEKQKVQEIWVEILRRRRRSEAAAFDASHSAPIADDGVYSKAFKKYLVGICDRTSNAQLLEGVIGLFEFMQDPSAVDGLLHILNKVRVPEVRERIYEALDHRVWALRKDELSEYFSDFSFPKGVRTDPDSREEGVEVGLLFLPGSDGVREWGHEDLIVGYDPESMVFTRAHLMQYKGESGIRTDLYEFKPNTGAGRDNLKGFLLAKSGRRVNMGVVVDDRVFKTYPQNKRSGSTDLIDWKIVPLSEALQTPEGKELFFYRAKQFRRRANAGPIPHMVKKNDGARLAGPLKLDVPRSVFEPFLAKVIQAQPQRGIRGGDLALEGDDQTAAVFRLRPGRRAVWFRVLNGPDPGWMKIQKILDRRALKLRSARVPDITTGVVSQKMDAAAALAADWQAAREIIRLLQDWQVPLKPVNLEIDMTRILSKIGPDDRERTARQLKKIFADDDVRRYASFQFIGTDDAALGFVSQERIGQADTLRLWDVEQFGQLKDSWSGKHLPFVQDADSIFPVFSSIVLANLFGNLSSEGLREHREELQGMLRKLAREETLVLDSAAWARLQKIDPGASLEAYKSLAIKSFSLRGYLDLVLYLQNLSRELTGISA